MRWVLALVTALALPVGAQEIPLGERTEYDSWERVREYLPAGLWEHRSLLFDDAPAQVRRRENPENTPADCTRRSVETAARAEEPLDVRGSIVITYRFEGDDESEETTDDTWLFLPAPGAVRHLEAPEADRVLTPDVALGELETFSAIPPQALSGCDDAAQVLVPGKDPSGGVTWELRDAWRLEFEYGSGREDVYVDRHSFELLYSFLYDRSAELWKITWRDADGVELTVDVQDLRDTALTTDGD